jgi:REP element-mobilizing transposase RayT
MMGMPRPLRIHYPGAVNHVTTRGVDRQPIFLSDKERLRFLTEVKKSLTAWGGSILSFCLMSNHEHLLIRSGQRSVSGALQRAFGRYSSFFNYIHGRTGHLLEGRFHSVLCKSDRQLVNTVAYIHMNPVEAGIVAHPGEWAWSSHHELVSGNARWTDLSGLAESTGLSPQDLREAYLERISQPSAPPTADGLLIEIAGKFGVELGALSDGRRGGAYTAVRVDYIRKARARGDSDADIARSLGCSRAAVSQLLRRV